MLGKNDRQLDFFDNILYEQLIPKDHLLIKIDEAFDFDFLYDKFIEHYSSVGRASKDPVMMVKILLIEYIYVLSDVQVVKRIQTDIAFRWFLGLSVKDKGPDDTTISHFRTKRMTEKDFEDLFTSIVKQCIEKDIVKTRRYIVDSTNVDANTNYPSDKQLLRQAYTNVSEELSKQNKIYASTWLQTLEQSIELLYDGEEKVPAMKHYEIVQKVLEEIYINTYDSMDLYPKYARAFGVCYMLIDKYINSKKDKIISIVDPDARVAHKSKGKCKTGYKNHIIVDEDSEIILSSTQTPFNVGDQKELLPLVEQVMNDYQDYGIKPDEISADKAYGTTIIRAELKDEGIICNVDFYDDKEENDESDNNRYKTSDFVFSEDITQARCPMGLTTDRYDDLDGYGEVPMREFIFDASQCDKCSERDRCLRVKDGKIVSRIKRIRVSSRYDVILHDKEYNKTEAFKTARDKRYKVERRFATMVNHRGMRRSRYIGISGAIRHIITGNTVTNIIRAVRIIDSLKICTP